MSSGRLQRLVLGTVALPDPPLALDLLDRFHAAGGRALDLASVYRDGEAQRVVGRWHRERGRAGELAVYAKGCHPPRCRPDLVRDEVETVRRDAALDRVDVFVLHRDDPAFPVAAWAEALRAEVDAGRIGALGVSNWTLERTRALKEHLDRDGAGGLAVLSNHFSLAEMVTPPWPGCLATARADLPELAGLGLHLLAWSSVATGYFAGREPPGWASPANAARRERARELGARVGASPTAVALAYVLNQPEHVLAAVGADRRPHLEEALAATEIELRPDELDWLERG